MAAGAASIERTITLGAEFVPGAVDPREFENWVQGAKPGARLTYAWGPVPPKASAAFQMAGELAAQGFLQLNQKRSERGWDFLATRQTKARARPERAREVAADDDAPIERLYRSLARRANLDLVCPTNPEINADLGVTNGAYLFAQLCKPLDGKPARISSADQGQGWRRIVTIAATGNRTKRGAL